VRVFFVCARVCVCVFYVCARVCVCVCFMCVRVCVCVCFMCVWERERPEDRHAALPTLASLSLFYTPPHTHKTQPK